MDAEVSMKELHPKRMKMASFEYLEVAERRLFSLIKKLMHLSLLPKTDYKEVTLIKFRYFF